MPTAFLLAALLVAPTLQDHDPQIQSYCAGKTTSFGCVPFVRAAGQPGATSGLPFLIAAEDGRFGQPGFLLYGAKGTELPYHGGTLCVRQPLSRTASMPSFDVLPSKCSVGLVSRLQIDFNQVVQSGAEPFLTAGQTVHVQWRQMDPGNPWGWDDNLSDGLRFTLGP